LVLKKINHQKFLYTRWFPLITRKSITWANLFSVILIVLISGCSEKYTPKPRGYFRIQFPEKEYIALQQGFPYTFEIPVYSIAVPDSTPFAEPNWINIHLPDNKAEIHLSYKPVKNNLFVFTEESRELTYKHTQKAAAIEERIFINPGKRVFGTIYLISGNAASPIQFYLTDSTDHFLRGALYIRDIPNIDSLKPVIDFLVPDVIHLIETTEWKYVAD
jgi:gliding motility-associated lipoprotein GldD